MRKYILLSIITLGLSAGLSPAATTTLTYDALGRLTKADYTTTKAVGSIAYAYDATGNLLSLNRIKSSSDMGDVNNDGTIDLKDAVLGLKVLSGIQSIESVDARADVDGDGKVGLSEVTID